MVVIYDIVVVKFKYIEGYRCFLDESNKSFARVTPKNYYTEHDVELVNSANGMWSFICVTKTRFPSSPLFPLSSLPLSSRSSTLSPLSSPLSLSLSPFILCLSSPFFHSIMCSL